MLACCFDLSHQAKWRFTSESNERLNLPRLVEWETWNMHHYTERSMAIDQSKQDVQQATMLLSHVEYEAPVLYLADGTSYVPVMALCEMLGLRRLCGMWTVCTCCQDGFYCIPAREFICSTRKEGRCLWSTLIRSPLKCLLTSYS